LWEGGREGLTFLGEDIAEAELGRADEVEGQAQDALRTRNIRGQNEEKERRQKHQGAEFRDRER